MLERNAFLSTQLHVCSTKLNVVPKNFNTLLQNICATLGSSFLNNISVSEFSLSWRSTHVACPSSSFPHVHLWNFFYKVNYWFIHLYETASCKVLQNQIYNTYLKLSSMSAGWSDCQLHQLATIVLDFILKVCCWFHKYQIKIMRKWFIKQFWDMHFWMKVHNKLCTFDKTA